MPFPQGATLGQMAREAAREREAVTNEIGQAVRLGESISAAIARGDYVGAEFDLYDDLHAFVSHAEGALELAEEAKLARVWEA